MTTRDFKATEKTKEHPPWWPTEAQRRRANKAHREAVAQRAKKT
jgi:hypothetical protein